MFNLVHVLHERPVERPVEWNEIKEMKSGAVERTIMDNTLPKGSHERTIIYEAPFERCDRERDYEIT